ncbi:MAG: 4Fe-4S dicluster domain-containing protein [Pseudomonadota bacterium]|nr:4Fe-4S dicluster domain-containing protein [Gammaproteobacteria bacterium]MBU1558735.1 4Fe-4S dicluster domain-containing protein [Gammaproteobacteria bacterium]MBU1629175.1 4Fe-4S dicluster domain-containing protein [Gammaproteobacteria bacterium]MBU1926563.1 4Fe-4S dicluster domain-containing protein [Gammaproteobacteria bacterium]MBU2546619.1 4Fe-4S dicluster domain-containing protein [Gammaproteobacteria bacterium]
METKKLFLVHNQLSKLLSSLNQSGYQCIGPQVKDGVIVYDVLNDVRQLPWGVRDLQAPGKYRLDKTANPENAFGWANGAQAIKPLTFKSEETLWKVTRDENGQLAFKSIDPEAKPVAIIGARPCDLAAMLIMDKVFIEGAYKDVRYQARREKLFTVVVNCTAPSANCFCVGANGDVRAKDHFDLAMTELEDGFVVEVGSDAGQSIIEKLSLQPAAIEQIQTADQRLEAAAQSQTKKLPKGDLKEKLFNNLDSEKWNEIAKRCLSCTNCTQVCPTCFCHSEGDVPALDGASSEHKRLWDSCFTEGHSRLHSEVVRDDTAKRYRQWLIHKLGTWADQFGTSGCVGCGRCITWCPVGIDITEEAAALCSEQEKSK